MTTATAAISRHLSTTSLIPNCSNDAVIQSFASVSEAIMQGCDKILASKCSGKVAMKLEEQANKCLCDHIVKLITTLCTPTIPLKIADVDSRIHNGLGIHSKLMPCPKNLEDFKSIAEKGKKRQLHIPADKIFNSFKEMSNRFDQTVSLYIVAILEHITSALLQVAMNYEAKMAVTRKTTNDSIKLSSMQTLLSLYWNGEEQQAPKAVLSDFVKRFPEEYDACSKELRLFLIACVEQISLIIRLFREPVNALFPQTPDRQTIFGNIEDCYNNLRIVVDAIDDMFESNTNQLVGGCFIDSAEDDSLNSFANYGQAIFNPECKLRLHALSENRELVQKLIKFSQEITKTVNKVSHKRGSEPEIRSYFHQCEMCAVNNSETSTSQAMQTSSSFPTCNFMVNSFKYLLPRLLLLPVFHFLYIVEILEFTHGGPGRWILQYAIYLKHLKFISFHSPHGNIYYFCIRIFHSEKLSHLTKDNSDRLQLNEVKSMLIRARDPLQRGIEQNDWVQPELPRIAFFMRTQHAISYNGRLAKQKLDELEVMIRRSQDSWERPSGIFEFLLEDSIQVRYEGKRLQERYIYLFVTWMLICKKIERKTGLGERHPTTILKVKKRITLDQFHMIDVKPTDDRECPKRLMFDMEYPSPNGVQRVSFVAKTYEQKVDWFTTLLTLQTQKTFTKYLQELPKTEIPLRLPEVDVYRFAEPDGHHNILLEDSTSENSADIPVIKAATLPKLIERITYHAYFDSKTLNSFMLVFRHFTTPHDLLTLLIERFEIPEPEFTEEEMKVSYDGNDTKAKQMLKRFRINYKKRVQLRVMNVLVHWVRNNEYFQTDFQDDNPLRDRLSEFLKTVESRHLQDGVRKIQKHLNGYQVPVKPSFDTEAPNIIDLGLFKDWTDVRITNVHPLEFARQITLYEWELYRRIEYWEVSCKEKTTPAAPNLFKSQDFSNRLKGWMVYCVMSQDNIDDRTIVMQRIVDLMKIFESMNNMQGAQEAKGALISASVFRLYHTHAIITSKSRSMYKTALEQLRKQCSDRNDMYTVEYQKKIRRLNPPCVPFIAFGGKTVLIHNKLANPDMITLEDGTQLINFKKHRLAGEVVEHYMSFQRTPYNFHVDSTIRQFLENMDPYELAGVSDEHTFDDYAFNRSLSLEPKNISLSESPEFETSLTSAEHNLANILNNLSFEEKINHEAAASIRYTNNSDQLGASSATISSATTAYGSQASISTGFTSLGGGGSSSRRTPGGSGSSSSGAKSPSPQPRPRLNSGGDPMTTQPITLNRPPPSHHQKPAGSGPGSGLSRFGTSPPTSAQASNRLVPDYSSSYDIHQHSMSDSHVVSSTSGSNIISDWDDSLIPPPIPRRTVHSGGPGPLHTHHHQLPWHPQRTRDPSQSSSPSGDVFGSPTNLETAGAMPSPLAPPVPRRPNRPAHRPLPTPGGVPPLPPKPPHPAGVSSRPPPLPSSPTAAPALPPRPVKRTSELSQ